MDYADIHLATPLHLVTAQGWKMTAVILDVQKVEVDTVTVRAEGVILAYGTARDHDGRDITTWHRLTEDGPFPRIILPMHMVAAILPREEE